MLLLNCNNLNWKYIVQWFSHKIIGANCTDIGLVYWPTQALLFNFNGVKKTRVRRFSSKTHCCHDLWLDDCFKFAKWKWGSISMKTAGRK